MRKATKFLHTVGSLGYAGAMAALVILHGALPTPDEVERYTTLRIVMGSVAQWMVFPSMIGILVSGLFSVAITPAFQNAGWVWAKLATGILVFEGTLVTVQSPMELGAERARQALTGELPVAELGALQTNTGALWILLGVALVNVALGVWRPRLFPTLAPRPTPQADDDAPPAPASPDSAQ